MVAAEPTGITKFVAENGQIIFFFGQIAFWLVVGVAAIWATWLFKRLVDFRTGATAAKAGQGASFATSQTPAEAPIKIDDFVE